MKRLAKHYKLVALSNVDRQSFARTCAGPLNSNTFWRAYPAQDLKNFEYLLKYLDEDDKAEEGLGIAKDQNLQVAQSLFHNHKPANQMGMSSLWINRKGALTGSWSGLKQMHDDQEVGYGWRLNTLGEFADEVERQRKK